MRLYLDTADQAAWGELMSLGIFHGITTNPLLAARVGMTYREIDWRAMAGRARELGAKELHAQVFGPVEAFADWAGRLYEAGAVEGIETVVKVPLVEPAIRMVPEIKALRGKVLMTACYDAKQMLVAQGLGADYIAPYYGRMVEAGIDATAHLVRMQAMSQLAEVPCRVMVASLRSSQQIVDLALAGLDTFTIAPPIARDLLDDPLTREAYAAFETAAK